MKENKRIRRTQFMRWGSMLALFIVVNFVLRLALIPLNQAEYTDGILQLTQFEQQTGVYPPLYTALTWPLAFVIGPLWSGRFVSAVMSALCVIPIFLLAQRCFGNRAAMFSALVYTVAPASLRWAPRVMTESTFAFFFWFACERLVAAQGARRKEDADYALFWANILGALAALTRYQGALLALPVLGICIFHWRTYRFVSIKGLLSLAAYGFVPLWSAATNTIHGTQLVERIGDNAFMTFLLNAEPFVLLTPYFITYPVAVLAIWGMVKGRARPRSQFTWITLYVFVTLLGLQSLFGSFQERYFLPFYGLLFIWAGLGMAALDHKLRKRHPRLRPYVPLLVVVWSVTVAFFVLVGSRQAWGDFRFASEFAAAYKSENGGRLFTNEIYRAERQGGVKRVTIDPLNWISYTAHLPEQKAINTNKAEFFARQPVLYLGEEYYLNRIPLEPGDILIMSSIYGADVQLPVLQNYYEIEPLGAFESIIYPVFPDIMSIPGTDQNYTAWRYRYTQQSFSTGVYRIVGRRGAR